MEVPFHSLNIIDLKQKTTSGIAFQIQKDLFNMLRLMIKQIKFTLFLKTFSIMVQLFQLLSFSFNPNFEYLWKNKGSIYFYSFFSLWQFFPFFENNDAHYFIGFLLIWLFLMITFIILIVNLTLFHRKKAINQSLIKFLAYAIHLDITILYIPILGFFNTVFRLKIDPNTSLKILKYSTGIIYGSSLHLILGVLAGLGILIQLFLSFIFTMTFFDITRKIDNPRSMMNPYNEICLLIIKTLMIGLDFILNFKEFHWISIILLLVFFIIYLYRLFVNSSVYDEKLKKYELIAAMILTWSIGNLFISIVCLKTFNFNGALYLFLTGCVVIIFYGLIENFDDYYKLFIPFENLIDSQAAILYIIAYLSLVEETDRKRDVIIKGYINHVEENCSILKCPLKRYLIYSSRNKIINEAVQREIKGLLLQHAQILFNNATHKFPKSVLLKIYYVHFLYFKLNKREQASNIIQTCHHYPHDISEEFLLYCFDTIISERIKDNQDSFDDDLATNLTFNNHCNQFNNCISLASSCYAEFWSVIINSSHDDIARLNDYGTKITNLVEEVKFHFNQILKLKVNNQSQIYYYTQFLRFVLNDEETADKTLKKYNISDEAENIISEPKGFISNKINSFLTEDSCYILISSREESFGIIRNISTRVCALLGYTKNELIGKSLQILLPDFLSKQSLTLMKFHNKKYLSKLSDPIEYEETTKELIFYNLLNFVMNKSKYIIPISILYSFVEKEEEHNTILVHLKDNEMEKNKISPTNNSACFILTNDHFIIQSFTSNCLNILELTTKELSNTVDITVMITQLHEEIFNWMINNYHDGNEDKLHMKRHLLETKYKGTSNVTWSLSHLLSKSVTDLESLSRNTGKKDLIMTHDRLMINNEFFGYVFRFVPFHNNRCSSLDFGFEFKKNNSDNKDTGVQIDKLFLPEISSQFILNPDKMSFFPVNTHKENLLNFREKIKENAFSKITTLNKGLSIQDSTDSLISSVTGEDNDSSSFCRSDSMITETKGLIEKRTDSRKRDLNNSTNNNSNNDNRNSYYHVNISKIKLKIYDFTDKVVKEYPNNDKISQVELKLNDKEESILSSVFNQISSITTNEKIPSQNTKSKNEDHSLQMASKDKLLNKQIQHALKKEEAVDFIIIMKFLTSFIFIMLFGFCILFLMMIILSDAALFDHFYLISQAMTLIYNFAYGTYLSRELVLYNIPGYEPLFGNDGEYYANNCSQEILDIYNQSISIMNYLTQAMSRFEQDIKAEMTKETINMKMIKSSLDIVTYNLSSKGSYYESLNALRNIAEIPNKERIPTNKYVFFFMNNSCNDVYESLTEQFKLYDRELNRLKKVRIFNISSSFIGGTLFVIFSYMIILFLYSLVINQKISFLQIFLEIEPAIINGLLSKCDYFLRLIQNYNCINDTESNEENDYEDKLLLIKPLKGFSSSFNIIQTEKKKKESNNRMSHEQKITSISILIFFCLYEGFLLALFLYTLLSFDAVQRKVFYFENINTLHWNYIQYFNMMREFIFFSQSMIVGQYSIDKAVSGLYPIILNESTNLNRQLAEYPDTVPRETNDNNLKAPCDFSKAFFDTYFPNRSCHDMTMNSFKYSITIGISHYLQQINVYKNFNYLFGNYNKNRKYFYNNTLLGTSGYDDIKNKYPGEEKQYEEQNSFAILNSQGMKELSIITRFILRPLLMEYLYNYLLGMKKEFNASNIMFIGIICAFCTVLVLLFFIVWKPFEKNLNVTITKTKNMLTIIPTDVLSQVKDIQKLLNINQSIIGDKKPMISQSS